MACGGFLPSWLRVIDFISHLNNAMFDSFLLGSRVSKLDLYYRHHPLSSRRTRRCPICVSVSVNIYVFVMLECKEADKTSSSSVRRKPRFFSLSITCQGTFILHVQGMFNLPCRGFRQRITSTSSVPMTLNDVIVHVRQFIIAIVSVDGCSGFLDPDGSRLGSLSTMCTPSQSMMWFYVVAWCVRADLLMVDINIVFRSLCISHSSGCLRPFCVPPSCLK